MVSDNPVTHEHLPVPSRKPVASLVVDTIRVDGLTTPTLIIGGGVTTSDQQPRPDLSGVSLANISAKLAGQRHDLPGVLRVDGERWHATFALTLARWNGPVLPLPSGSYRLELDSHGESHQLEVIASLPDRELVGTLFGIAFTLSASSQISSSKTSQKNPPPPDQLTVVVTPPLTANEYGIDNQRRLEATYRSTNYPPIEAVFFESFYGANAACNPLGIDKAIAELLPTVSRYWSVIDSSVTIPDGAIAIVEGSEQWWRIRGSARLLVVNDWLRKRYKKRKHQKVLQTWHGTPLKKIALSRPQTRLRATVATLLERSRWDILLAQNPHSARVFRRAYAFLGPIWQVGYPRNDVLFSGDASSVRARLGIAEGPTVLLYAPTWRDDRPGYVDHLDVAKFAESLGDGYVTLIRGHSRSLKPGTDVLGNRVMDVTSYPDVSDLFLVADALITDYSSVMFDFSVTGKPLFFFAPDLEHYREKLRGFYFDLASGAPGPLVSTAAGLIALIGDRDDVHARYTQAYATWREKFNPRDDGAAGHRIVERLIRAKIVG